MRSLIRVVARTIIAASTVLITQAVIQTYAGTSKCSIALRGFYGQIHCAGVKEGERGAHMMTANTTSQAAVPPTEA